MILRLTTLLKITDRCLFSMNKVNIYQNVCGQIVHIFVRAKPPDISTCSLCSKKQS